MRRFRCPAALSGAAAAVAGGRGVGPPLRLLPLLPVLLLLLLLPMLLLGVLVSIGPGPSIGGVLLRGRAPVPAHQFPGAPGTDWVID